MMTVQGLSVLHEPGPVVIVLSPAVSNLLLLDGVLPAPVPLDQTDHHADAGEEDQGQHHPDEPAGAGHRTLVDLVHGREAGVCGDVLDPAGGLELTVNCHHPELVGEAGLQSPHYDRVLIQLILRLDPLSLLLLPENTKPCR